MRAGWINVFVASIIMLATLPGRTQGLGLITEPMLLDLRLDRVTYANVNLWATLIGAIVCLPVGRLFDRAGLRGATFALTLALSGVVWTMSRLKGGTIILLFLLVLATRAIGQSALSVASITAVGKSFGRRVGAAMGVYSVLLSVFMAAAFMGVGNAVRLSGWRNAWEWVAYGLLLFAAPLVLLLREGTAIETADSQEQGSAGDLSLAAALRTPAFWVFAGGTSLFGLVSSGLGLFNQAILEERGFDQPTFVKFLAASSIIALAGQGLCGWLTLRWPMRRLLGLSLLLYAVALGVLPLLTTLVHLWAFAVLIGLSGGMIIVLFFAVWRHFGVAHLGRIQGAAQMLTVLASAIGPLIFAQCAALTGSYAPAIWILTPCVFFLGLGAFRVPMPRPIPLPASSPV